MVSAMSNEQRDYHRNVSATVLLGFGGAGVGVAILFVFLFLQSADLRQTIVFAVLACLGGFVLGAIVGGLVSLLVSATGFDNSGRTMSGGRQIVGEPCQRCGKTIGSIVAGNFCGACGRAMHFACMSADVSDPNACSACGSK